MNAQNKRMAKFEVNGQFLNLAIRRFGIFHGHSPSFFNNIDRIRALNFYSEMIKWAVKNRFISSKKGRKYRCNRLLALGSSNYLK